MQEYEDQYFDNGFEDEDVGHKLEIDSHNCGEIDWWISDFVDEIVRNNRDVNKQE